MTTTIVPESQPQHPGIDTILEFNLDPKAPVQIVCIPDGWRPLGVRSLEHSLLLIVRANTSAEREPESFLLLHHGDDLGYLEFRNDCDLAFIGQTWDGAYLFLQVPREHEDPAEGPARKIGRMDL